MSERIAAIKLDALNGTSLGGFSGNFNLQLPTGSTYRELIFRLVNITKEQITRISLTLNGDEFIRVSGPDLELLRKATGQHQDDGVLVLPFTDTTQSTMESQNFSELVTMPGENLVLKIETAAANGDQAGKVANIDVRAKFAGHRAQRTRMPRLYKDGHNGTRAGEVRYSNFVNQNKNGHPLRIQRMFIENEHVDNLKIKRGMREIFDKTLEDNNFDLQTNAQPPVEGVYLFDAVQEGFAATDAMNAVGNFEFVANLTQAGDFEVMYQACEILTTPVARAGVAV